MRETRSTLLEGSSGGDEYCSSFDDTGGVGKSVVMSQNHSWMKMVWVERSVVTFEIDRAINHYKSSLQRLVDVLLSVPDKHAELPLSSSAKSKVDIDEKTIQYMRKLSRKAIQGRSSIYQSLLSTVQDSSRDKLLINAG